jgi:hypothetical protein
MVLLDLQGMETPEVSSDKLGLGSSHCDGNGGSELSLLICVVPD